MLLKLSKPNVMAKNGRQIRSPNCSLDTQADQCLTTKCLPLEWLFISNRGETYKEGEINSLNGSTGNVTLRDSSRAIAPRGGVG